MQPMLPLAFFFIFCLFSIQFEETNSANPRKTNKKKAVNHISNEENWADAQNYFKSAEIQATRDGFVAPGQGFWEQQVRHGSLLNVYGGTLASSGLGILGGGVRLASTIGQAIIGKDNCNSVCNFASKICERFIKSAKAELYDRLTWIYGSENADEIATAFGDVNWSDVASVVFDYSRSGGKQPNPYNPDEKTAKVVKSLIPPIELMGQKFFEPKHWIEKTSDLTFMNALIHFVLSYMIPFGCGIFITDDISKPFALILIRILHPLMEKGKVENLEMQMKYDNHELLSIKHVLSTFYQKVDHKAFFHAVWKKDVESALKVLDPLKDKLVEELSKEENVEKAVKETMTKILAYQAPWILVIFNKFIQDKIEELSGPIAEQIKKAKKEYCPIQAAREKASKGGVPMPEGRKVSRKEKKTRANV